MFKLFKKYNQTAPDRENHQITAPENKSCDQTTDTIEPVSSLKERIASLGDTPAEFSSNLLSFVAKEKEISQGIFFTAEKKGEKNVLKFLSGYAYDKEESSDIEIDFGEGFTGQVAIDGKLMIVDDVPDGYISIVSGLGKAKPASIIIFPLVHSHNVVAVIELASFHRFTTHDEEYFKEVSSYAATCFKKMHTKK
jgi:putative methionine-R-sulfoxide reductase with GAF domain